MAKQFCVYILASDRNGTIYVGVISNILRRIWQHKEGLVEEFTKHYDVDKLVWMELHESAERAITREKRIKKWNREWKLKLIEAQNPYWNDLYPALTA